MKLLAYCLLFILFVGCSSVTKQDTRKVSLTNMSENTDLDICTIYGYRLNGSSLAKKEIIKRNLFSNNEWNLVEQGKIQPGMSECALLAAYGLEGRVKQSFTKNKKTKELISKSYIFDCNKSRSTICPQTEVVIKNGKIYQIKEYKK